MKSIKTIILSRLPWGYFFVTYLVVKLFRLIPGFYKRSAKATELKSFMAIEAGAQGWHSIEFKELYSTAIEYIGTNAVLKVTIDKLKPYLPQIKEVLQNHTISHYLYDPRTGTQSFIRGFIESVGVGILLARYRVTPIVYLTDYCYRLSRCQSAAVSANSGVVVTFILPRKVQDIFPHRRLIGPSLMPISCKTLDYLEDIHSSLKATNSIQNVVRFTGSLYEPRKTLLEQFRQRMSIKGYRVEILGREIGTSRVPDNDYWVRLSSAEIIITTADQMLEPGRDMISVPHLVYRYLEVLACGSLLLAPDVPGISRYFRPGIDFVSYTSIDEAIDKAEHYLLCTDEARRIKTNGHLTSINLIRSRVFWTQIDTALGSESILI